MIRAACRTVVAPVHRLFLGMGAGALEGLRAGFVANAFLASVLFVTAALRGDIAGAVGGALLLLAIGSPVAMVFGLISGMVAGGALALVGWLDGAPVVFAVVAAAHPLNVITAMSFDDGAWETLAVGSAAAFWVIGHGAGRRFLADGLAEPPVRIEVGDAWWAVRPT